MIGPDTVSLAGEIEPLMLHGPIGELAQRVQARRRIIELFSVGAASGQGLVNTPGLFECVGQCGQALASLPTLPDRRLIICGRYEFDSDVDAFGLGPIGRVNPELFD